MSNSICVINEQEVLGKQFRVYGSVDEPLFLAKDVATWIEHTNVTSMVDMVDENEKRVLEPSKDCLVGDFQANTSYTFLTEDGLYEVLMLSRKPIAKQFKSKVKEILKTLRKTGSYSVSKSPFDVIAQDLDPIARIDAMKEILLQQRKLQEEAVTKEKEKTMVVHSALSNVKDQYVTLDKRYRNTMDIIQEFSKGVCGASVTDTAKAISSHNKFGVKVSGKQLMEFLRAKELILKNNTPSQKAIDEGVLVAEFIVVTNGNKKWPKLLTKVTSKGLVYVTDLLLKEVLKQEDEQFCLF